MNETSRSFMIFQLGRPWVYIDPSFIWFFFSVRFLSPLLLFFANSETLLATMSRVTHLKRNEHTVYALRYI